MDLEAAEDEKEDILKARERTQGGVQRVDHALRRLFDKGSTLTEKLTPGRLERKALAVVALARTVETAERIEDATVAGE